MSAIIIPFPKPCRPIPYHADPLVAQLREILKCAVQNPPQKGGAA